MSRDIRSFFQPKKTTKPKLADDDDVIPESPDVQIQNKKKASKKKRVILDDSDEDIIFTSKDKKSKNESSKTNKNKKSPQKPALKEVKVSDLFGKAPVKRTEPLVKKDKKKTEVGIHSDDDFDQSLLELDVDNVSQETKSTNEKPNVESKKNDTEKIKSPGKKEIKDKGKLTGEISSKPKEESSNRIGHNEIKNENKRKFAEFTEKDKQSQQDHNNENNSKTNEASSSRAIYNDIKNEKKRKFAEFVEIDKRSGHDHANENSKTKESSSSRTVYNEIKNEKKRKFAEFAESDHKQSENDIGSENKKKKTSIVSESKSCKFDDKNINGGVSKGEDSDTTIIEDYDEYKHKKKKLDKSLNESVLTDEERHERRRQSAALYQQYLNRSGPKHLGAKEIPEGPPNCLKDCAFLLTGVLDSFERDDIVAAINKYGGSIKSGISKKVTHVLAGEDAGPAKMAKAQELGIKIINEDQFLQLIANPTTNKNKLEIKKEVEKEKSAIKKEKTPKNFIGIKIDDELKIEKKLNKHENDDKKDSKTYIKDSETIKKRTKSPNERKKEVKIEKIEDDNKDMVAKLQKNTSKSTIISLSSLMWVDKYKPQNIKQIIGQHGDSSNVKKLINWLTKWYVNRKAKLPKPNPWAKNDDGGYYKAALLSGPPGVGKTTTVALVCKELGFDMVEFNASDTRNKTLIKEQIGELLTTTSLSGYAKGNTGKQAVTKKHVLVMDEVDGMAGNEDRGGLQELISLIKSTSVPIICMCNDRNSQKMRSFVNYCYDLRFSRPRVDQIKSAMMSICFKEGIKIPPDVLTQLIVAANQDVRQTLNLLSLWAVDPTLLDADRLRRDANNIKKDIKLGPWEAIRKVFSEEEHKKMSIHDKSDLFFYDYSLAPLFVQENYLQVAPHCPKNQVLDRVSRAADSISAGDLVDARIRRAQAWSLLPLQAMYSSVIPGFEMAGHMTGQINFPAWLGKNSRATKMHRLCQEIHAHTRLSTSGSKSSIFLDYCSYLRDAVVTPLIKDRSEGIEQALQVLESYHLLRDDLDSLTEMSLWPGQRNPMILIDSKVKAAMTRSYNKKATALPYAPGAVKRVKTRDDDDYDDDTQADNDDVQDDSDPENDALIKKKKADKPSSSKEKQSSSKDKSNPSKEKATTSKEKKKKK